MAKRSVRRAKFGLGKKKSKGSQRMKRYIQLPDPCPMKSVDGKPIVADGTNLEDLMKAALGSTISEEDVGKGFGDVLSERFAKAAVMTDECRFIRERLNDVRFKEDLDAQIMAREIADALEEIDDDRVLVLPDGHWKKLAEAVKKPQMKTVNERGQLVVVQGYLDGQSMNYVDLAVAIRDATLKDPRGKDPEPEIGDKCIAASEEK